MTSKRYAIGAVAAAVLGVCVQVSVAAAQTPAAPAGAQPATEAVANPCTGADEAKCATLSACAWLPGFKIQGAADVPGYCRTAPKPLTSRRPGDPPKQ